MKLPFLKNLESGQLSTEEFLGYNHNPRIADAEFYDMENLCSDYYPVLSVRERRGVIVKDEQIKAITFKNSLCYVKVSYMTSTASRVSFVMNGEETPFEELSPYPQDQKRRLVSMGAYLLIFPDKLYINTENLSDRGFIEQTNTVSQTTYTLCNADGGAYGDYEASDSEPSKKNNLDLWLDTSVTPNVLKQYSSASAVWVDVASTYVRIEGKDIAKRINQGDGVTITGCELEDLNGTFIVEYAFRDEGDPDRAEGTNDYIVVLGTVQKKKSQSTEITVSRLLPDMDYVIEAGNRLWGCKYGFVNGTTVNEIYASKLGDFKNWNCFEGISTDSYAASRGSDGAFTGAINYFGQPIFFKEGCMHKISGSYPANFTITDLVCRGVEGGSSDSLAIVNEKLFYKSPSGICVYDGSLPQEASAALGNKVYKNGVAGAFGNKYYVSLDDEDGKRVLFVYDAAKGIWMKEDAPLIVSFCAASNDLCFLTEDGTVYSCLGRGEKKGKVSFFAETGAQSLSIAERKFVSCLTVRFNLSPGSLLRIYVQYDGMGEFIHVGTFTGKTLKTMSVPIRMHRCDHFRLRFEGEGECKIFSVVKTIEEGGLYR